MNNGFPNSDAVTFYVVTILDTLCCSETEATTTRCHNPGDHDRQCLYSSSMMWKNYKQVLFFGFCVLYTVENIELNIVNLPFYV
jgi:hypothetical protein